MKKMDIELFCVWCGGKLASENKHVECHKCGTEFSNVLVSETTYESSENTFLETGISFDCIKIKSRHPGEYILPAEEAAIICE